MIESLIKHLERHAKLEDSIDVERFDATLSQIAALDDPRTIGFLVPFFDDKCKFPEVMFSIVHTIERFDDEIYIREILKALPALWKRSPYWTNLLHFRIFNHPVSRGLYRRRLGDAEPNVKAAAKELLVAMAERERKFKEACNEMLAVL